MTQLSTIGEAAIDVLKTVRPGEKTRLGREYAAMWSGGRLRHEFPLSPPARPARPDRPELLAPRYMPRRRNIGRKGNMVALLHAIAHIEFNAVDLAWDIVARFGRDMPQEFTDDWVKVAGEEARHFAMIDRQLKSYDAAYGDLPAHDGLWQSAMDTAHDLKARLAIVPLVLEARGLDVTPAMITRAEKADDPATTECLKIIYHEEIRHVHAGQKWFCHLCALEDIEPERTYQGLVRQYFKGRIKPPFNKSARALAGFDEGFYLPLAPPGPAGIKNST